MITSSFKIVTYRSSVRRLILTAAHRLFIGGFYLTIALVLCTRASAGIGFKVSNPIDPPKIPSVPLPKLPNVSLPKTLPALPNAPKPTFSPPDVPKLGSMKIPNPVDVLKNQAEKLDPTKSLRDEFEKAHRAAMANLAKLDPAKISQELENALRQQLEKQIGATYDPRSGKLELRGSSMGRRLTSWLHGFAQGNERSSALDEFYYSPQSRELFLRAHVRHRQSWGKIIPGQGKVYVYDLTQTAMVRMDFKNSKAHYKIDFAGGWAPAIDSERDQQSSDGNIVASIQSSVPSQVGKLMHHEETDQYDAVRRRYESRYGKDNVYFASKKFVNWARPETVGNYVVNGVITGGTAVYKQIMSDLHKQAENELPQLGEWAKQRGMSNVESVARELISGKQPRWPFLKFEMTTVRYASRNKPLNATATPWIKVDHLAFVIIYKNGTQPSITATGRSNAHTKPASSSSGSSPQPEMSGPGTHWPGYPRSEHWPQSQSRGRADGSRSTKVAAIKTLATQPVDDPTDLHRLLRQKLGHSEIPEARAISHVGTIA